MRCVDVLTAQWNFAGRGNSNASVSDRIRCMSGVGSLRWIPAMDKKELNKRWREINNALTDLADLRVWPSGQDIAQLEGELLRELDSIEYELGQGLLRSGLA